jgi:Holliday junction resolvasome RuvABC DNA-binding subunit
MQDAVLALISLGYKQVDALKAVNQVSAGKDTAALGTEDLVRMALKTLI